MSNHMITNRSRLYLYVISQSKPYGVESERLCQHSDETVLISDSGNEISVLSSVSRPVLRPTQHPIKWVKGKAIQLQAWTVPESSRNLRHPDFKTIRT